jgi:uncharacterized membrane protein YhaH (DUF805 family)
MTSSGAQLSGAGHPPIRPSRRWYWVAGGLLAGGVICIAFAVAGFFALNRQIADFQRVPVPGQAGVTFTQPGGYVLYVEEPGQCCSINVASDTSSAPFPSWSMQISLQTASGGPQVSIGTWQGITESYGVTGHQGQAAMDFTIDHPGRYLLAARNATPGSITDVAVGRGIGRGILIPFVLIVAGAFAVLAGLVTGVVTVFRRRASRRRPGPPVMPQVGEWRSPVGTPGEYTAGGHLVPSRSYLQGGPAGFGEAIKEGLRNWLVYRGRASRSAYWWFILFTVIVSVAFDVIVFVIAASANTAAVSVLITVLFVVIAVLFVVVAVYLSLAGLALLVRRLHDSGRSGWWVLIGVVPLVGAIMLLVFTLVEGTPGPNRYDLVTADAAAGTPPLMCLECGAENAGAAQVCARCGAPLAHQPPVAAGAAGESRGSIPLPQELAGRRSRPGARRNALVMAGAGLAALAAVIVVLALATSPTSSVRPTASNSPRASGSPKAAGSPSPSARQLSYDQLRPGDCVQLPNINTISTWPNFFTVVPCAQPHTGEVFFTGDIWPQSIAYPGDNATNKQAEARCGRAFTAYDGISSDQSAFNYAWDLPDSTSWLSGDRSVQCVAYDPNGAPINYSIKGSNQ